MAKIFRPTADSKFFHRMSCKRTKQKYWALPALYNRPTLRGRKEPLVHRTLIRIWQHLHHLSSHAPAAVELRYRPAARKFEARYLAGNGRGSARFINKYTAHRWM